MRNRILGNLVQRAAEKTLAPARILLLNTNQSRECLWTALPGEIQSLILRHVGGDRHTFSHHQWGAFEVYAAHRDTLRAAVKKAAEYNVRKDERQRMGWSWRHSYKDNLLRSLGLFSWETNPGEAIPIVIRAEGPWKGALDGLDRR